MRSIWWIMVTSCPATMRQCARWIPSRARMLAVVLPLIGRKRFEEREICFADNAMQFNRFARIAFVVLSAITQAFCLKLGQAFRGLRE